MKRIFTLLLCLCALATVPADGQTVPVSICASNFMGTTPYLNSIVIYPKYPDAANWSFFPIKEPIQFNKATTPSLTNGFVSTSLSVGEVYQIDFNGYGTTTFFVYLPESLTNLTGTNTLSHYQTSSFFVTNGIATTFSFAYPNEATTNILVSLLSPYFSGGSGSGSAYNFSSNFNVTSGSNVDIGASVVTNGGQILDSPAPSGQLSIATATRSLNDASGAAAVLWGSRMLYSTMFTPALDWQNRIGYGAWNWTNAGNVLGGSGVLITGLTAGQIGGLGNAATANTNTILGMAAANLPAGVVTNLNQIILLNTNGSSVAWPLAGLNDAQRGTNLVSALAALEIGGYLEVPAGSFLIHNLANYIPQASTIKFDDSYLYIDATSSSSLTPAVLFTNILFYSDFGVANWNMIGPATFDGMLVPCPTVGYGGTGKSAICVQSGINRKIQGITFTNWSGIGFWNPNGGGYGLGQNSGSVSDCIFLNCQNGIYVGGEYWSFVNDAVNGNTNGIIDAAGNLDFANCRANMNNVGFALNYYNNGGHSTWVGGELNHNVTAGLIVATNYNIGVNAGPMKFIGCDMYVSTIQLGGAGIVFQNCDIAATIQATVPGFLYGQNMFFNCAFPQGEPTNFISMSASDRTNVVLLNWTGPTNTYGSDTWSYNGTITAANGVILPKLASIPTNSMPVNSASVTNWTSLNLNGTVYYVATNFNSGGWLYSKQTGTVTTSP